MQKSIIILVSLVLLSHLSFARKVILNPSYEFRTTGISEISRIEIKKNETKLWIHCTFLPKWWIKFNKQTYIKDAVSGEKLFVKNIENGEFDKEMYMPASGDSTFVLVFPALPRTSRTIDYGKGEKTIIYGVSLKSRKTPGTRLDTIPASIAKWLDTELAKAKKKTPVDYSSPEFFTRDTARVVGYIKGYDRRAGFSTGIVYASNELTDEEFPTVITIHEDGRFETNIPTCHPKHGYLKFGDKWIGLYIEPGLSLSMILNWEDFLTADRLRNVRYSFKDITFGGPLAAINADLLSVPTTNTDYNVLEKSVKTLSPADFKTSQLHFWSDCEAQLERELKGKNITPQAEKILRNEVMVDNAAFLFDYIMNRAYQAREDTTNNILKIAAGIDYYDFMKRLPLNDPSLLITQNFSTLINRFEFAEPFSGSYKIQHPSSPKKSFQEYLFKELKLKQTEEDKSYLKLENESNLKMSQALTKEERDQLMKSLEEKGKGFYGKYNKHFDNYSNKYLKTTENAPLTWARNSWLYKDSILKADFKLQPTLVYDIAKVRSLKPTFENVKDKDAVRTFLTSFEMGISHPFLASEAERLFYEEYPSVPKTAYDLPEGKGADIFRKIIEPHKGKTLIVDFWGIFCGPCIASIKHNKESREKHKDNGSFDFIFITSESDSPLDRYTEFVKEQDLVNTYRISSDDYQYLRQLFRFNGIPRYVLIGKDGKVINDDFEMHNFQHEIQKFVAQKSM